jgi:hypothetical protein
MDAPLQLALPLRYDGAERRRAFGEYPGAERRLLDPSTEQDHPELYEPQPGEIAVDPQQSVG